MARRVATLLRRRLLYANLKAKPNFEGTAPADAGSVPREKIGESASEGFTFMALDGADSKDVGGDEEGNENEENYPKVWRFLRDGKTETL